MGKGTGAALHSMDDTLRGVVRGGRGRLVCFEGLLIMTRKTTGEVPRFLLKFHRLSQRPRQLRNKSCKENDGALYTQNQLCS